MVAPRSTMPAWPRGLAHTSLCCSSAATPVSEAVRTNCLRSMFSFGPARNTAGGCQLARETRPRDIRPAANLLVAEIALPSNAPEQATRRTLICIQPFQQLGRTLPHLAAHRRSAVNHQRWILAVDVV